MKVVEILSAEEINRTLVRLASQILEAAGEPDRLALLGIHTRGVPMAQMIADRIQTLENIDVPVGSIDITFYRDDLDRIGMRTPEKTDIPFDLNDRRVILIDDVIYTGRTIRAALNAVHEYGRPELVWLAVLVDRGHRQLPIHPNFTGKHLPTAKDEKVKVYVKDLDGYDGVELISPQI